MQLDITLLVMRLSKLEKLTISLVSNDELASCFRKDEIPVEQYKEMRKSQEIQMNKKKHYTFRDTIMPFKYGVTYGIDPSRQNSKALRSIGKAQSVRLQTFSNYSKFPVIQRQKRKKVDYTVQFMKRLKYSKQMAILLPLRRKRIQMKEKNPNSFLTYLLMCEMPLMFFQKMKILQNKGYVYQDQQQSSAISLTTSNSVSKLYDFPPISFHHAKFPSIELLMMFTISLEDPQFYCSAFFQFITDLGNISNQLNWIQLQIINDIRIFRPQLGQFLSETRNGEGRILEIFKGKIYPLHLILSSSRKLLIAIFLESLWQANLVDSSPLLLLFVVQQSAVCFVILQFPLYCCPFIQKEHMVLQSRKRIEIEIVQDGQFDLWRVCILDCLQDLS